MSGLPPFEQFFAFRRFQPALALPQEGDRVLFVGNISGQFNLWSAPLEGGWPEQLTAFEANAVRALAVRRQDGLILFAADEDGDEFHQIFTIEPGGGWPERLTDAPQVQHLLDGHAFSPDGMRFAYAANARTPSDMEVWVRDLEGGGTRPVFGEGMFAVPVGWSPDGSRLLAVEVRSNSDLSIHLVDVDAGSSRELTPHEGEAKFVPGPWAPDGSGFYLISDEGREFAGLAYHDLVSGERRWVETPENDVDEVAGSPDGRLLAWIENVDGWARLRVRDLESGELLPEPRLPQGPTFIFGSGLTFSADGRRLALIWDQPRRPQEIYVVETETGEALAATESRMGGLREDLMGSPELVRFPTWDGREIPAWLYRPEGDGPAPFVLAIHGGPEAQERPSYRGLYQYLRSRGIGVLATNIRGSTGYGKSYQRLIYHDWGGGDLGDFEAAAKWLGGQEWVDPERLAVYGGSYGGFATLSCLARLPELWAVGVDIVGPSNLVTFARAVPPTWKRFIAELVGDPDTEEEFLRERSPITYAEDIRAPLLVIQGAKDPRVVQAESDQLVERLRELGREIEYEVFEDEGHGFTRYANEVRAYRLAAEFLELHLARDRAPVG